MRRYAQVSRTQLGETIFTSGSQVLMRHIEGLTNVAQQYNRAWIGQAELDFHLKR